MSSAECPSGWHSPPIPLSRCSWPAGGGHPLLPSSVATRGVQRLVPEGKPLPMRADGGRLPLVGRGVSCGGHALPFPLPVPLHVTPGILVLAKPLSIQDCIQPHALSNVCRSWYGPSLCLYKTAYNPTLFPMFAGPPCLSCSRPASAAATGAWAMWSAGHPSGERPPPPRSPCPLVGGMHPLLPEAPSSARGCRALAAARHPLACGRACPKAGGEPQRCHGWRGWGGTGSQRGRA